MDNVGGSLCIYQPEPGKKIPTSSPSRFLRAPFSGCECARASSCMRDGAGCQGSVDPL